MAKPTTDLDSPRIAEATDGAATQPLPKANSADGGRGERPWSLSAIGWSIFGSMRRGWVILILSLAGWAVLLAAVVAIVSLF